MNGEFLLWGDAIYRPDAIAFRHSSKVYRRRLRDNAAIGHEMYNEAGLDFVRIMKNFSCEFERLLKFILDEASASQRVELDNISPHCTPPPLARKHDLSGSQTQRVRRSNTLTPSLFKELGVKASTRRF